MTYIKNQILQNNALEAWAMSIRYCDCILEGKAALEYRKHFVSALHNAVELFVKQLMLNNTDYRVIQFKNGCNSDGQPARDFYNSKDLNDYFSDLYEQTMRKFFSIEFNKIIDITNDLFSEYYAQNSGSSVKGALSLLNKLRNSEMHFFIDKDTFLLEKEFQQLHNFMIVFYDILHFYSLLPFWGRFERWEYTKLQFDRKTLSDFTYKNAVRNTKFVRNLKEQLESEIFPASLGGSAFNIADSIACVLNEYQGNRFEDLWIYIETMLGYKILTYHDEVEEYEIEGQYGIEKGCNVYRQYYIDI